MAEIFLMEDSHPLRRVLIQQIRDAGHNVVAFENGRESGDAALMDMADVVVTDLSMPGVDGAAVIRNVADMCPDLPVIVITGDASASVENLRSVDSVLTKPFAEHELIGAIEAVLERCRARQGMSAPVSQSGQSCAEPSGGRGRV